MQVHPNREYDLSTLFLCLVQVYDQKAMAEAMSGQNLQLLRERLLQTIRFPSDDEVKKEK